MSKHGTTEYNFLADDGSESGCLAEAMIRCAALQAAATLMAGARLWSVYTPEELSVRAAKLAEGLEVRLRRPR